MERNTTATRTLVILLAVAFALFGVATSCKSPTSSEPTGDTKAPTIVSITSTKGDPTGDSPIDVTIVFSEAVTGFEETDLTLTNATSSNFVNVDKKTFTVDLTPVAEGTVTLDIAAKVCKDRAGNRNKALGTAFSRAYTQKPFATISSTTTLATNVSPIPITIAFNQPVDNFEQADVTVNNCNISNFQNKTPNLEWTADLADPSELAPVEAAVPAGVCYKQGTLVPNVASATFSRKYDKTPPDPSLSSSEPEPTNTSIQITITFSEEVTGFTADDIMVSGGGSAGNLQTSDNITFTADVTPGGQGSVTISLPADVCTDLVGNNNTAAPSSIIRTYDSIGPSVTLSSAAPDPTNTSPIPITITFSESVTGFTLVDISVSGGSAGNLQTSDNTVFTAEVAPSGDGLVSVNVAAGVCQDAVGNDNSAAAAALTRIYDTGAPGVTLSCTSPEPTNSIQITIAFTEEVTGFTAGDITVSGGGSAGNLQTSDNKVFTADITPAGQGSVTISLAANVCTDLAGNNNLAAPSDITRTYDSVAPTVNITSTTQVRTGANPIPITMTFSESVTGFAVGDLMVGNGTASGFAGGPSIYTCNITPTAPGLVTVDIAGGACQDAAGNGNTAATQFTRTYLSNPTIENTYNGTGTTSLTISNVTVGSNSNRLLLVLISARKTTAGANNLTSVSWNGTPMTIFGSMVENPNNGNRHAKWIYYIINPTSATGDVTTVWGANPATTRGVAYSLYDVLTSGPTGGSNSSTTAAANWTITVAATAARSLIFDIISAHNANLTTLTPDAAQTLQYSTLTLNGTGASTKPTTAAGNITMNWTIAPAPTGGSFRAVEILVAQ